ncbi:hypothetical protein [Filimonas effusa]|uniref:Uncharacterized protein n=1 Tax=Filimonas effusa TaxID=2508721 RepID=A0A4Q1D1E8_9BACT|nr:hypothetical protein [Filimonas effusa]RXK81676.1 hypothetical protein ESB13_17930 [Filimonas effusa]
MVEKVILKVVRCNNGLKIRILEGANGRELPSLWYEGNVILNQEIVLGEFIYAGNEKKSVDYTCIGWNTRLTTSSFDLYLYKRLYNDSGDLVSDNIICRFSTIGFNTDKVDADNEFPNSHRIFTFDYNHKFNDNSIYQYHFAPMEVIQDVKILANDDREGWDLAQRIYYGTVKPHLKIDRGECGPSTRIELSRFLHPGQNRILFMFNQYGSGGTNTGIGKAWAMIFRSNDSMMFNFDHYGMATATYVVFDVYLSA